MTAGRQHSRSSLPPSNASAADGWRLLGVACREVAATPVEGGRAVEPILERALEATGAERAFVVGSAEGGSEQPPRVLATVCRRRDGERLPSRTVVGRSLVGRRVLICPDAAHDPRFSSGASVRALALRFVVSAPIGLPGGGRGALVLDSRLDRCGRRTETRELLQAFAALIGLVLERDEAHDVTSNPPAEVRELIGESPAFREVLARAEQVAPWPLPVLVTGESGSGKEGIARTLHRSSPRRNKPFVALNCAAVTESLLESELFGAVRGAYTGIARDRPGLFRLADGGTLLLDEVGDMSPGMQAKLLRVLQDGRVRSVGGEVEELVDVRVVAATHQDLGSRVEEGAFRQDLYYRLAVVELRTPPLRDRSGDIPLLARHLSSKLARRIGADIPTWTPTALSRLEGYDWPGNIRELEAVVARALLQAGTGPILRRHVVLPRETPSKAVAPGQRLEVKMIEGALRDHGGVASHAAAAIGWSRQKLARRMAALGIGYPVSCSAREITSSHSSTPHDEPSRKAPHSS